MKADVPKTRFGIAKRPQIEKKGRDRDQDVAECNQICSAKRESERATERRKE